ncbi:MAG: ferrochelatase [Leptospirillia bacterium]
MTQSAGKSGRHGVLLVNLGTPDAPTEAALRVYLKEFLSDPRVVDTPRLIWWVILHGIILRTRPAKSAALYQKVWTDDGAPLLAISRRQRAALEAVLAEDDVPVHLGMRYGNPRLVDGLQGLVRAGCDRVTVLPLFPQFSISTTASVQDAVDAVLCNLDDPPQVTVVRDYHDHPAYIAALAASVREVWSADGEPERLLISFHGTPERYRDKKGDPYYFQCETTARKLAEALDLPGERWTLGFQSRFGREPWLQPYATDLITDWAAGGVGHMDVICPGFSADCLETLEEVALGMKSLFDQVGGDRLRYLPALNDRPDHIAALADVVRGTG